MRRGVAPNNKRSGAVAISSGTCESLSIAKTLFEYCLADSVLPHAFIPRISRAPPESNLSSNSLSVSLSLYEC